MFGCWILDVWVLDCGCLDVGFGIWGVGFWVLGFIFGIWDLRLTPEGAADRRRSRLSPVRRLLKRAERGAGDLQANKSPAPHT